MGVLLLIRFAAELLQSPQPPGFDSHMRRAMKNDKQSRGLARAWSKAATSLVAAAAMIIPGWSAAGQSVPTAPSSSQQPKKIVVPDEHMSEALRSSVNKVVVVPGLSPANQAISGSYEKYTPGLIDGIDDGSRIGTISKEIGGVPINFPIPGLALPGAIFGGITGKYKREVQEFRDALTEVLANAASQPLTNENLALDVFWGIRKVPNLESKLFAPTTPIPKDTDAILYVSINSVRIDVQGNEAILTISAGATLSRMSDGRDLYETVVHYQQMDELTDWTRNDNALFRDYANFARHYLGRELTDDVFARVSPNHELVPTETDTTKNVKKNEWHSLSKSLSPILAWNFNLTGGDSYGLRLDEIDAADIYYDVEIYDLHELVYAEEQIHEPSHTVMIELEACQTYRWSVRPTYHVGSDIKVGEWMRFTPDTEDEAESELTEKAMIGRNATEAPAYIQDFAKLDIKCGRR